MSFGTLARFEAAGAVPARGFTSMGNSISNECLLPCNAERTLCKLNEATGFPKQERRPCRLATGLKSTG
jgi:hypothetical protein